MPLPRKTREISGFIICRDEVSTIRACIESLDICSEIVVVDSGSTDGTLELLRELQGEGFPLHVFERAWEGYAKQKQFALDQCTQPWCINLDADERLDDRLKATILSMELNDATPARCAFLMREFLPGYGYPPALVHAKRKVRMVRRSAASYNRTLLVHESLRAAGEVLTIRPGAMLHFRDIPLMREMEKANLYSSLKAREKHAQNKGANLASIILMTIFKFVKIYVLQRYFICRTPGLIFAAMEAQYTFLTEAKLYRLARGSDGADA